VPYLLRHSFATIAWSLGLDIDTARRIMRHTDTKMLDRIYTRPRPKDLVARAAAFDVPAR
jgi:integrase